MGPIYFNRLIIVFSIFFAIGGLESEWGLTDRWDRLFEVQFDIGKDTTFIEKPLREDGVVDYLGAFNEPVKRIRPEDNAAVLLMSVRFPDRPLVPDVISKEYYRFLKTPAPMNSAVVLTTESDFTKELTSDDKKAFEKEFKKSREALWKTDKHPRIAEFLRRNERFLTVAVEASKRPQMEFAWFSDKDPPQLSSLQLHHADVIRPACQMLTSRALLKAESGDLNGAYVDLDAARSLGALWSRGRRCLIEHWIGVDIVRAAAIAEGEFVWRKKHTLELRRQRIGRLMETKLDSGLEAVSNAERMMALSVPLHWLKYGVEQPLNDGKMKLPAFHSSTTFFVSAMLVDGNEMLRTINRHYDEAARSLSNTSAKTRFQDAKRFLEGVKKMSNESSERIRRRDVSFLFNHRRGIRAAIGQWLGETMTLTFMPAFNQSDNTCFFALAHLRLNALAHALKVHKQENGAFPKSLGELKDEFKPCTIDPATDQPFAYNCGVRGRIAYFSSAGRDGVHQAYVGPRPVWFNALFPNKPRDAGDDIDCSIE